MPRFIIVLKDIAILLADCVTNPTSIMEQAISILKCILEFVFNFTSSLILIVEKKASILVK